MFKALHFFPWMKSKKPMKKITLGICCMDKKAQSKPMREILSRLPADAFEIIVFGDECIQNAPIEEWPVVEVLITFYSTRFPTQKALEYIKMRNPFLLNDLEMDWIMRDRRKVYELLKSLDINLPHHVFLNREPGVEDTNVLEEFDEYIVVNGVQVNKPLVEKPVSSEDHNIYIYYPMSAGGGSKRLFRKIGDRSSEFYPHVNEVRRDGSYIYEEFVITQGTDVKVYTVGADYGHAEARKSPVVDGRVKRDNEGLEVRYPVILSPEEKIIARKIVKAFKQTVCGFDLLRVEGKSYCCDVNGFSFVKNSRKYYDDASQIIAEIMISAVRPEYSAPSSTQAPMMRTIQDTSTAAKERYRTNGAQTNPQSQKTLTSEDDRPGPDADMSMHSVESSAMQVNSFRRGVDHQEELRCVIAIIRHADRTPKQKMKIKVTEPKYLDYFHSFVKSPRKELKVKSKSGLLQFLQVTKEIIEEMSAKAALTKTPGCCGHDKRSELLWKLIQIRDVLDDKEISGINRKLQMKPQKWNDDDEVDGAKGDDSESASPSSADPNKGLATEIQLILKWGGDLTPLGRDQAETLGAQFRHLNYPDMENGGVLRLHSTYRHDLKIKASDEGRVMKTAAAFTKGLLELEGQLTPILASLVVVEEKNRQMLDRGGNFEIKEDMERCKQRLDYLQVDQEMTDELVNLVAPGCSTAMRTALYSLKNPLKTLRRMHELISQLTTQLSAMCSFPSQEMQQLDLSADLSPTTPHSCNVGLDLVNISESSTCESTLPHAPSSSAVSAIHVPAAPDLARDTSADAPRLSSATVSVTEGAPADVPQLIVTQPTKHGPDTGRTTPFSILTDGEDGTNNNASSVGDCSSSAPRSVPLYLNETIDLMFDRWDQICKAFYSPKNAKFDLTKVPDVYDMVKYDILHNSHLNLVGIEELFELADAFENCVVPQEYGTDQTEKRYIGSKMCSALLEKINLDLNIAHNSSTNEDGSGTMLYKLDESHAPDLRINSLGRSVRTRLYFTSESHMHTLLNVLRFAGEGEEPIVCKEGLELMDNISEVSYLSQIVIRLFEDRLNPLNFHCELSFSPGAVNDPITDKSNTIAPYVLLDKGIKYGALVDHLQSAIKLSHQQSENPHMQQHHHGSATVNMDQAGNLDGWELDGDAGGGKKKDKKEKKDKKDKKEKKDKN